MKAPLWIFVLVVLFIALASCFASTAEASSPVPAMTPKGVTTVTPTPSQKWDGVSYSMGPEAKMKIDTPVGESIISNPPEVIWVYGAGYGIYFYGCDKNGIVYLVPANNSPNQRKSLRFFNLNPDIKQEVCN